MAKMAGKVINFDEPNSGTGVRQIRSRKKAAPKIIYFDDEPAAGGTVTADDKVNFDGDYDDDETDASGTFDVDEPTSKERADIWRQVAKGLTLGYSPRIIAGVRSLNPFSDETYEEAKQYELEQNKNFEEEHAAPAIALQVLPSLATGGGVSATAGKHIFNGVRALGASRGVAGAASVTGAGAGVGGVAGSANGDTVSDRAGNAATGAAAGAVVAPLAAGAMHVAAPVAGYVARKVADQFVGSNKASSLWAESRVRASMRNDLKSQGVFDEAGGARSDANIAAAARARVASQFDDATAAGMSKPAPVGYVLRDAINKDIGEALKKEGAVKADILRAADDLAAPLPGKARTIARGGRGIGNPAAHREFLVAQSTTAMSPRYEGIVRSTVPTKHLADLANEVPAVRKLLEQATEAAHVEQRIASGARETSANMGAVRQLTAKQQAENALARSTGQPVPHAETHPAATTAGVLENIMRRASGRISPDNAADLVTDRALAQRIQDAIRRDAAAYDDHLVSTGQLGPDDVSDLTTLIETRGLHAQRKSALESFDAGHNALSAKGIKRLEHDATTRAHIDAAEHERGLRASLEGIADDSSSKTIKNIADSVLSPRAQRLLREATGPDGAAAITQGLSEVGTRAAWASSIKNILAGGGGTPDPSLPVVLSRAFVNYQLAPTIWTARFLRDVADGMNTDRASALLRLAAEPANAKAREKYIEQARQIVVGELKRKMGIGSRGTTGAFAAAEATRDRQ